MPTVTAGPAPSLAAPYIVPMPVAAECRVAYGLAYRADQRCPMPLLTAEAIIVATSGTNLQTSITA